MSKGSKGGWRFKRLAIFAGACFGGVLFVLLAVSVYNMTRTVSSPQILMDLSLTKNPPAAGGAPRVAAADRDSSPTRAAESYSPQVMLAYTAELLPLADMTTSETQARAIQLNRDYLQLVKDLGDFENRLESRTLADTLKSFNDIRQRYDRMHPELESLVKIKLDSAEYFHDENFRRLKCFKDFSMTLWAVYRKMLAHHGQWLELSVMYRRWYRDWESELYCYRQMGAAGKKFIAARSSERLYWAFRDSLMSVGPGFHWPRLRDDY